MSNQQKDNSQSGSPADQGLHQKARDDTGGPRGDALSGAVDAAAGDTGAGNGSTAPPAGKDGASKA